MLDNKLSDAIASEIEQERGDVPKVATETTPETTGDVAEAETRGTNFIQRDTADFSG